MKSLHALAILTALLALQVGCVPQEKAERLQDLYRVSQERVVELESRLEECERRNRALMESRDASMTELQDRVATLSAQRDKLDAALSEAEAKIREMAQWQPTAIDPQVDAALAELAETNPGMMTYDRDLGMVKFESDLTFGLGSDKVSDAAGVLLGQLATVLKSPGAAKYEVRIVGHTDNVPVTSAAGRQKYGDNWGLSTARAISVMRELKESGIAPVRMGVCGYGEHRPIVANQPKKGAAANRRVEIYLVPMRPVAGE